MMFLGIFNKSVIITYLGVSVALVGCYLAIIVRTPRYAVLCLIIAGICDLFDGVVARKCQRNTEEQAFGVQIDSLADMVSFVLLPLCLGFALGLDQWYHLLIFTVYTLTVITRLGFFNTMVGTQSDEPLTHYRGLPVTYAALILPLVWLLSLVLGAALFAIIYAAVLLLLALLFIMDFKVAKPKGRSYVFFSLLAIVLIGVIIFVKV
jgi:CDP-diacylglycerol--serine O-phosphatidyltransferase